MPPKKKPQPDITPKIPCVKRRSRNKDQEREKLRARFVALLFECDDYWSGKRDKHSHVHPIFKEYWRLVQIAKHLYPKNLIFDELDISEETQPNVDDIQAVEMDIRKLISVFEVEDFKEDEES
ncbi:MAG: hypothetical protein KAR56_03095 [Thermoplasmata archaeon]|nr:hypothetical protein [Thermoplasmata archaeon]